MGVLTKVRARRRYREMSRRLTELDRTDELAVAGTAPSPEEQARARRRRLARAQVAFVLFFVAVIGVLLLLRPPEAESDGSVTPAAPSYPPLPADASTVRILPAVVATTAGPHTFVHTLPNGAPVTYDPCRPIHYVINPAGMPDRGLAMVREAIQEVSAASGLAFHEDGFGDEPVVADRDPKQTLRYGDKWPPVLIGWADERQLPGLAGDVTGLAGSSVFAPTGPGSERYITGDVALDRDWFVDAVGKPGGYVAARGIVIHELGHLVGLGHVADGSEIMNASRSVNRLGPGDREGFAAVGAGTCRRDT